jgi:hypothetical protein
MNQLGLSLKQGGINRLMGICLIMMEEIIITMTRYRIHHHGALMTSTKQIMLMGQEVTKIRMEREVLIKFSQHQ